MEKKQFSTKLPSFFFIYWYQTISQESHDAFSGLGEQTESQARFEAFEYEQFQPMKGRSHTNIDFKGEINLEERKKSESLSLPLKIGKSSKHIQIRPYNYLKLMLRNSEFKEAFEQQIIERKVSYPLIVKSRSKFVMKQFI